MDDNRGTMETGEEEEVEQLEEMRSPFVSSWVGADGVRVDGVVCVDDGIIRLKNRCRFDECAICYQPSTTHGKHQICSLPCGHTYGFSCIKKWLLQSSSGGKCPQCKTLCSFQDAKLLYPARVCVTDHQKELFMQASSAAFFPFTNQGYREFQIYEFSRKLHAQLLQRDDIEHMNILGANQNELGDEEDQLVRRLGVYSKWIERLEEQPKYLEVVDAMRSQASLSKSRIEALGPRIAALGRLIDALRRRIDALQQRIDAYTSRKTSYIQMYKEHCERKKEIAKAKWDLEMKKKLAEKAAADAEKKGEKEVEKAAEKKLMDEEMKDEKKMHASGTVDVPEEEMVEAVAEEPTEEKVEVKAEPTTMTTERVRARSRSNREKGLNSISKVIRKHKKSNNYMNYYAAAAVLTTVPLAVGYSLYA